MADAQLPMEATAVVQPLFVEVGSDGTVYHVQHTQYYTADGLVTLNCLFSGLICVITDFSMRVKAKVVLPVSLVPVVGPPPRQDAGVFAIGFLSIIALFLSFQRLPWHPSQLVDC